MPRRNSADHNMGDKPPGRREQSKDKSRMETKRTQNPCRNTKETGTRRDNRQRRSQTRLCPGAAGQPMTKVNLKPPAGTTFTTVGFSPLSTAHSNQAAYHPRRSQRRPFDPAGSIMKRH